LGRHPSQPLDELIPKNMGRTSLLTVINMKTRDPGVGSEEKNVD
jgi:hypothetical protein